jgi:predicted RNase H-like HicB family nuclease
MIKCRRIGVSYFTNTVYLFSVNAGLFHNFTVVLQPDDNGTFVAYVPAIPGCHALGRTPEEAQAELVNVFEMIKEEYEEEGKPLPRNIDLKAVHAC